MFIKLFTKVLTLVKLSFYATCFHLLQPFCQYVLASGISERELQTMQQCLDTLISKTVVDFSSKVCML